MNSKSLSSIYNHLKSNQSSYNNSIISKKIEDNNINESNSLIEKNNNILNKLYIINKEITPMNILEKIVNKKFINSNSLNKDFYNIKIINEIICNENTHIVAEFKDFLIKGDYSEFLQKVYTMSECKRCLPKIFEYYDSCSVIFPNYVILPESKYIYKNIQRKQRIIDNQEDLENKKKKIQKGLIKESDDLEQFFTIHALDSILDQTDTSGIKKFFGVNQDDNSEKNISLENIINKITNAENNNNIKLMNERKFSNTTLKKNNDINKKRMGLNFNTINSKIKGRNYNRYLNGGYNSLSNNNREKKNNYTGLNVNSTTSNGMKNTKVSSTTIDVDSKNFIQNNNSINSNKKIINKNLNNSIKKPKIIQSLFTNNNKEYVIKIFKEVNKKVSNKLNNKKTHQRNIKSFSPINKSLNSKSKVSNIIKKNNKLSPSSSSSTHNQISSYNSKKIVSNPKIVKNIDKIHHKKTLSYNAIKKDKNESSQKKIKDIPLTERGFFNKNYHKSDLVVNIKKNKSPSKKNSISPLTNKKVNSNNINNNNNSNNNNINYNKKENKEKIQKNGIKNIKNIFNREIISGTNINSHNNKSPDTKINLRNLNMLSLSPDNNILKSFNSFNSSNDDKKKTKKKVKNSVFPKNNIQGIQIKGFKYFTKNSNSNSRNTSNSERIIFSEALVNKISRTNKNKNTIYNKTYLEMGKKKF